MAENPIDPELVAALIDGSASGDERERALAALARSNDAYEDFLEANHIVNELGDGAPAQAAPSRWRRRGLFAVVPLLAAAVVVVIARPWTRGADSGLAAIRSLSTAQGRASMSSTFGSSWDTPGWSVVRGADAPLSPATRAFRTGARFAELELAISLADTATIPRASATLARIVSPASATLSARVERLDAHSPVAEREELWRALSNLGPHPAWFSLGAWSEAARLAMAAGRADFFRASGPAMIERERLLHAIDGNVRDDGLLELRRQLAALDAGRDPSNSAWAPAAAAVDSLIRLGGR